MRMRVQFLALLSGVRILHCHELWCIKNTHTHTHTQKKKREREMVSRKIRCLLLLIAISLFEKSKIIFLVRLLLFLKIHLTQCHIINLMEIIPLFIHTQIVNAKSAVYHLPQKHLLTNRNVKQFNRSTPSHSMLPHFSLI